MGKSSGDGMGSFRTVYMVAAVKFSGYSERIASVPAGARYIPAAGWWLWNSEYATAYFKHSLYDEVAATWRDSYGLATTTMQSIVSDGGKAAILNTDTSARALDLAKILETPPFTFLPLANTPAPTPWQPPADGCGYMFICTATTCYIVPSAQTGSYTYSLGGSGGGFISSGSLKVYSGTSASQYLKSNVKLVEV